MCVHGPRYLLWALSSLTLQSAEDHLLGILPDQPESGLSHLIVVFNCADASLVGSIIEAREIADCYICGQACFFPLITIYCNIVPNSPIFPWITPKGYPAGTIISFNSTQVGAHASDSKSIVCNSRRESDNLLSIQYIFYDASNYTVAFQYYQGQIDSPCISFDGEVTAAVLQCW